MKNDSTLFNVIDYNIYFKNNLDKYKTSNTRKKNKIKVNDFIGSIKTKLKIKNNNNSILLKQNILQKLYFTVLTFLGTGFIFFIIIILSANISIRGINTNEDLIYNKEKSDNILTNYIFSKEINDNNNGKIKKFISKKIEYIDYRVKKNDNFEKIAKKFGLTTDTIFLVNGIKKERILKSGTLLKISNQDGRIIKVRNNDSIFKIAYRYGVKWEKIVDANILKSSIIIPGDDLFIPGSKMTGYEKKHFYSIDFIWPVRGKITSYFGSRLDPFTRTYGFHSGLDIKNRRGSKVKAARDGKIVYTGWQKIYGNFIIIKHHKNLITVYAHLDKINVKKNQKVKQGQSIGLMGSTGRSTGTHLHFEIREKGKVKNPLHFLK